MVCRHFTCIAPPVNSQKLQRKARLTVFLLSSHIFESKDVESEKKVCLGAVVPFYQQKLRI